MSGIQVYFVSEIGHLDPPLLQSYILCNTGGPDVQMSGVQMSGVQMSGVQMSDSHIVIVLNRCVFMPIKNFGGK